MNGGIHTERKVGNRERDRERNRIGSSESEHESLLVHENKPKFIRNNQLNLCSEQGELSLLGNNFLPVHLMPWYLNVTECFLLLQDEVEISAGAPVATRSSRSNIHSGNNYELSEFDARGPTYRYDCSN